VHRLPYRQCQPQGQLALAVNWSPWRLQFFYLRLLSYRLLASSNLGNPFRAGILLSLDLGLILGTHCHRYEGDRVLLCRPWDAQSTADFDCANALMVSDLPKK
jgi:hypothetical protein